MFDLVGWLVDWDPQEFAPFIQRIVLCVICNLQMSNSSLPDEIPQFSLPQSYDDFFLEISC